MIALIGAVIGLDVGFSPKKKSSAICRLEWDRDRISWRLKRFSAEPMQRAAVIEEIAGGIDAEAAAFDGPLLPDFAAVSAYRLAERMLTLKFSKLIGKPGASSAPVGRDLNAATNACAKTVLNVARIADASHGNTIHAKSIVEAFPSSFMGVMLEEPQRLDAKRSNRSDVFFQELVENGSFGRLLAHVLPGRRLTHAIDAIRNHDDRAAFVCALTALCVARRDFTCVGDGSGWIVLPPRAFVQPWAQDILARNASLHDRSSLAYFHAD